MNVELRHINKHFGRVHANNRVSLTITPNSIHGLLGENGAGKTTLMSILAGYVKKDSGDIFIDGKPASFSSPRDAAARGIGMLHQDTMDVPVFSALENFMLGRVRGLKQRRKRFARLFVNMAEDFGFPLHPDDSTAAMTPGARQQLDIIRLLSAGTRLLILDEPTTGLSEDQKTILFKSLRKFVSSGSNSVVLVSHKISDIQQLCDQITVLRQGDVSGSLAPPFNTDQVVRLMFGARFVQAKRKSGEKGKTVFTASGVSVTGGRAGLTGIDFSISQGEIVGLAGLGGSGQELFLKTAAGLVWPSAGKLMLHGKNITGQDYHGLKKKGIGYIPSDRLRDGLAADLTIADHFSVAENAAVLATRPADALARADEAIARFQIKGTPDTPVHALSGGNQQRLLLALLPEKATLLFLDNPTRGLDPESAALLWSRLHAFRDNGGAVVFSSADLDELLSMADRIAVFFNGRLVTDLPVRETTVIALERAITGKQYSAMDA